MGFDYTVFIDQHKFILYLGIVFVGLSISFFETGKNKSLSLILLILGAIDLRLFVALVDPFLHMWDEQFHALVAKSMMSNPFKPLLIADPILSYDYKNWTGNHVWLHKQPLFLWQIALSFKLFGINELALRIPNIIMSSISVFFIYRIGSIVYDKRAGFYGAVLFAGSNYFVELTSGRMPTDHNDYAFLFYVTASIWAWFEFMNSKNRKWIIAIGVLSGFAILNKWLTGLLVYSGWFIAILADKNKRSEIRSYVDLGISAIIAGLVTLPWQIYILQRFPREANYEFAFNSKHFFEAIEAHSGTWTYHFEKIIVIYGSFFQYLIIAAFLIFFFIKNINWAYKIAMTTWVLAVYIFFTLAATKMIGFTGIVAPLVFSIIGISISYLVNLLINISKDSNWKSLMTKVVSVVFIFSLFFFFADVNKLTHQNMSNRLKLYSKKIKITDFYKKLPELFTDDEYMFFNVLPFDHTKVMFYTDDRSRSHIPTQQDLQKVKDAGVKPVVFDNGKLPDYIKKDNTIAKVISPAWKIIYKDKIEIYY